MSDKSLEGSREPPMTVVPGGIEVRPRRIGMVTLDLIIAGCAILISGISLFIAIQQSRTMQKQLAAASWPLLQFSSGNTDDQNKLAINMSLTNAGVGPALIKRFRILYGGKSYDNYYRFLRDCCGYSPPTGAVTKFVHGTPLTVFVEGSVVRAAETRSFLFMELASDNLDVWKKLDRARFKVKFDACYCSVLGDCWHSDLTGLEAQQVAACPTFEKKPS